MIMKIKVFPISKCTVGLDDGSYEVRENLIENGAKGLKKYTLVASTDNHIIFLSNRDLKKIGKDFKRDRVVLNEDLDWDNHEIVDILGVYVLTQLPIDFKVSRYFESCVEFIVESI